MHDPNLPFLGESLAVLGLLQGNYMDPVPPKMQRIG
jgi:hypothetical protein